jgi:hypothetical protein
VPLTVVGVAGRAGAAPVAVPSVLVELGSALHVLRDPGHHDAAEWATTIRARMSPRLAESVRRWSWTTQAIRDALMDQFGRYGDTTWAASATPPGGPDLASLGEVAQRLWTVPGPAAFRHASIHLDGPAAA